MSQRHRISGDRSNKSPPIVASSKELKHYLLLHNLVNLGFKLSSGNRFPGFCKPWLGHSVAFSKMNLADNH